MERKGIAIAGSILVDTINEIPKYPQEGELTQIASLSKATGGCVPNVAADLKLMDRTLDVYAVGCVGDDGDGELVRNVLNDFGVDTSRIKVLDSPTSFTQVMSIPGGQRTFFTYSGASALFGSDEVDVTTLPVRMLHLGYFLLLEKVDKGDGLKILQKAKEAGIQTSIDLVSENSNRYLQVLPCLPYTDYLIINETEAGRLAGITPEIKNIPQIAERLLQLGVQEKVIIHFPEGAVCASNGGVTLLGSCILPKGYIKGSTGAGDAFCAGALYAIYHGLTNQEILEYGSSCAARALSSQDAVSAITDIKEILSQFKTCERRKLSL